MCGSSASAASLTLPAFQYAFASFHGALTTRMLTLRTARRTLRAAGQATLPTTGRSLGGRASAAACATLTGSDFTFAATTRETMMGCWMKPLRSPPTPALADLAETFGLASDTTR
ncbi:hypothetical protein GCM10020219_015160 [Nonomuraea dietziae]